jgi:hypothetical protein
VVDFAIAFFQRAALTLLRNTTVNINTIPTPPPLLSATTNLHSVTFIWGDGADANQSGGLTYNLRVGSRPGANDIMSAMSLPDGTRLLPSAGNVGGNHSWTLTNLTAEACYWSVQAVDNSFAGSVFAPEQKVAVNPSSEAPAILFNPTQQTFEDTPLTIPFQVHDDLTPANDLQITAHSTDPSLVRDEAISIARTNETGSLTLLPATNRFGTNTIILNVTDASGLTAQARFQLSVLPVNDPPVAFPQFLNGQEDTPLPLTLHGSDPENDPLSFSIVTPPSFGTISLSSSNVVYMPFTNFFGVDQFAFVANDGQTNSSPSEVYLNIAGTPDVRNPTFNVTLQSGGNVNFMFKGEPYQNYRVWWSEDLVNWTAGDKLISAAGILRFSKEITGKALFARLEPE